MVREEIRYDFSDYPTYADVFIKDLLRLMIISKLNTTFNGNSRDYFNSLVNNIDNCSTVVIKYGKPLIYARYNGMEFAEQKVTTLFKRINEYTIDVILESPYDEFIKSFDLLSPTSQKNIRWNTNNRSGDDTVYLLHLLDIFVNSIHSLTQLDEESLSGLQNKTMGIRNVSVTKKYTLLELSIDEENIIIEIEPTRKNKNHEKARLLVGSSEISKAIVALMNQA